MAQNIISMGFRWLRILCEQPFDGSKHYANSVSIAPTNMLTAFRWLKILSEQRFDGSKQFFNNVSMAQNIT